MRKLILTLAIAMFLLLGCAGCATYGWIIPPTKNMSQRKADKMECYKLSVMAHGSAIDGALSFLTLGILGEPRWQKEQRVYNRCLHMKGWRWGEIHREE